ncbi:sigma-70 family RNA polymerase sigma factor [Streptomyces sp. NPDC020800]|uniref:sigma-70 family RNA polymerase sigma factor n=1 Tax=Streptomyces sp. NPDC020800 TaxID=3365092 RepID=UPI0037B5504B
MSINPPLCSSSNGDGPAPTTSDAGLAAEVDEAMGDNAGLAAKVDEAMGDNAGLAAKVDEAMSPDTAENAAGDAVDEVAKAETEQDCAEPVSASRRRELMTDLFPQVRFELFDAFCDPRCDVLRFTAEAFTQVLPALPAGVSNQQAYDKLMDTATQLAADDRPRFEKLRGYSEAKILSLQMLYGFKFKKDHSWFPSWLAAVDGLPPKERTVFFMIAYCGWTNAKTAKALGISESQASKLMTRAKKKLTATAGAPVEELMEGFFHVEITRRNRDNALPSS